MNALERALLGLRADIARNPDAGDDGAVFGLLDSVVADSDANLRAAAALLDLDRDDLEERAAIIEFDAGMPRTTANRLALAYAIQALEPGASAALCKWFAHNAAAVLSFGHEHEIGMEALRETVQAYFRYRLELRAAATEPAAAG